MNTLRAVMWAILADEDCLSAIRSLIRAGAPPLAVGLNSSLSHIYDRDDLFGFLGFFLCSCGPTA